MTSDGSSPPFVLHSRLCAAEGRDRPPLRRCDLPSDSPQERGPLASNRSHAARKFLACRAEAAITGAQTDLRLPGDVAHGLRQPFQPGSQGVADSCGIAICPGRLDQRPPRAPVAGQGETLPSDRIAGRALRRDKKLLAAAKWVL